MYVHSPSTVVFPLSVPANAHLHFGMGITAKDNPVKFRVSVEGASGELFSKTLADPDHWEDADVDLLALGRTLGEAAIPDRIGARRRRRSLGQSAAHYSCQKSRPNVLIYTIDTLARRPFEPLRLRPQHHSVPEKTRRIRCCLRRLSSPGNLDQIIHRIVNDVALFLYSRHSSDADTIPSRLGTLAEQLRAAGYVTASIVSTPFVGRATGLERGFDYLLEYPVVSRQVNPRADRATDSVSAEQSGVSLARQPPR